jgi:ATP diphosphatase
LLERANRKFTRRFQRVEEISVERGLLLGEAALEELNAIWENVKEEERE